MTKIKKRSENIIEINGERFIKEDLRGWLNIPELNIAVEIKVHDKNKSWNDLNIKDDEELLTVEQCTWLANSKYSKQLKMNGSSTKDDFFIQHPFNLNKKKGYIALFFAESSSVDLYCIRVSDYCSSSLGVRFARKILKSSKTKKKIKITMENKIETDKNEYAEICFAQAKCETWKERLHEGSCTYKEFLKAMKRGKNGKM